MSLLTKPGHDSNTPEYTERIKVSTLNVINSRDLEGVDWINLAQNSDKCRAPLNIQFTTPTHQNIPNVSKREIRRA